jgi:hypothetical protein
MPSNFLQYSGGTNGFVTTPFNLMTTELNALGAGAVATSSVGGTSGVFNQASWGSAPWGFAFFKAGGSFTPTAGQYLAGWFLLTPDASTYELTLTATDMPRAPDFVIPFLATAHASGNIVASGLIRLPFTPCKCFVANRTVALPSTGNVISLGSVAIQY